MAAWDVLPLVLSAIAIFGTWVLYGMTSRRENRRTRLEVFIEYTNRYREVVGSLPGEVFSPSFRIGETGSEAQEQIICELRKYFDMCSEEHWLHSHGRLDLEVWTEWESGMEHLMSRPAFAHAWDEIQKHDYYYAEFRDYFQKLRDQGGVQEVAALLEGSRG